MSYSKIEISQFMDKFDYPIKFKAKLSTMHSDIIDYAITHYVNSKPYKQKIALMLNTATAVVLLNESCDMDLSLPYDEIQTLNDDDLDTMLGDKYVPVSRIEWDVSNATPASTSVISIPKLLKSSTTPKSGGSSEKINQANSVPTVVETPKEDLYLRPPIIPRFDPTKPWLDMVKDGERYTIYTTLPIIPTVQNEISVTTDISKFTESDFMNLYPNRFIRTRKAIMYEPCGDLPFDLDLGVILPISGYTEAQVRKNIIEYPHFYKLIRFMNDKVSSFYSQIEIDGELLDTMSVWDELPDSKFIPRSSEFIKEYVVRRWLLERDSGIEHKYPMYGTLEKFLTLFTTPEQYASWGYDPVELGKSLVSARVSFLRSRNPIIRRCIGHG